MKGIIAKAINQGRGSLSFIISLMKLGSPLMKNILTPLTKSVLIPLEKLQQYQQQMQLLQENFWIRDDCIDNFKRRDS